jgi:hypothetical protein
MNAQDNNLDRYKKASKKVKSIKEFYSHLFWYIVINLMLFFLNLKYSPEHIWFFYTTLGWGLGVIAHAVGVFGNIFMFSKDWEDKKIKAIMEEENNKSTQNWE